MSLLDEAKKIKTRNVKKSYTVGEEDILLIEAFFKDEITTKQIKTIKNISSYGASFYNYGFYVLRKAYKDGKLKFKK